MWMKKCRKFSDIYMIYIYIYIYILRPTVCIAGDSVAVHPRNR